jgi:hypothetical protein
VSATGKHLSEEQRSAVLAILRQGPLMERKEGSRFLHVLSYEYALTFSSSNRDTVVALLQQYPNFLEVQVRGPSDGGLWRRITLCHYSAEVGERWARLTDALTLVE